MDHNVTLSIIRFITHLMCLCYNQLHEDISGFREKDRADGKSDNNSLKNNMKTMTINNFYSKMVKRLCKKNSLKLQ